MQTEQAVSSERIRKRTVKHRNYFCVKNVMASLLALFLSAGTRGYAQTYVGISGGLGVGNLTQKFTQYDQPANFSFTSPAANLSLELLFDQVYFEMSFNLLFAPFQETIGNDDVNKTDYATNLAIDFSALNIGYLHPVNDRLSIGGAIGFHVAAPYLSPKDENDYEKLRFGGNYGLIGLGVTPRVRYALNETVKLTLNVPFGLDFGAMSEDVVVGGVSYGKSPAIVQPASLVPRFKGYTAGIYLSLGYFFQF